MTSRQAVALAVPCMSRCDILECRPAQWKTCQEGCRIFTWFSVICTGPFSRNLPPSVRPVAWHVSAAASQRDEDGITNRWLPLDEIDIVISNQMTSLILRLTAGVGDAFEEWDLAAYRMNYWRRCTQREVPGALSPGRRKLLYYQAGFDDLTTSGQ